jgi:predicted MFS family arabinose efflux permease
VSRPQRIAFVTVLVVTMAGATFALFVFGVLAADLIAEFGVARWQVGALVTASSVAGALLSPFLGGVADRIGARSTVVGTLTVATLVLLFVASAPTFVLLVAAAVLTGVAQAASNPGTNKLISLHVEPGRRGVITGLKQSGVQFGTFLGGLLLPVLAAAWGWRGAVLAFTAAPSLALLLALLALPRDPHVDAAGSPAISAGRRMPPIIRRLAVYGFLMGAGGTTIFTYLPLYAQEELGLSQTAAGTTIALAGLVGIIARIGWSRVAEIRFGSVPVLSALGGLAALAAVVLLAAPPVGAPLLWVGAVVTGASASAWNAVGMLAVIQELPASLAGRGSGTVNFGFLAGLGIGAPVFGWSVDRLGTYRPGWAVVTLLFVGATAVMVAGGRRRASARA